MNESAETNLEIDTSEDTAASVVARELRFDHVNSDGDWTPILITIERPEPGNGNWDCLVDIDGEITTVFAHSFDICLKLAEQEVVSTMKKKMREGGVFFWQGSLHPVNPDLIFSMPIVLRRLIK